MWRICVFFFDRGRTTPYHCALMSEGSLLQQLPRLISPRKLAYGEVVIEGPVESTVMTRLAEAVDSIGVIDARLAFSIREDGKMIVSGKVSAKLVYQCQRCLQSIPANAVEVSVSICIVRNEDEAKALSGALDPWIVDEDEVDVYTLVEDELLLSLPVVSYHESECVDASLMSSGDELLEPETKEDNPFSVLSALKNKDSKQ